MSEKPQPPEEEQEDLLEQIFTQGLEKIKTPAQAMDAEELPPEAAPSAPDPEDAAGAALPADQKSRHTTVYLCLLILFTAAFLIMLLLFFLQRRSSESAISELRDSMNRSQEELLAELRDLEAQNNALNGELERLNGELAQWQTRYESQAEEVYAAQASLYSWQLFWELERFYLAGDYEGCAAILILKDQGHYGYCTPDAALQRYDEIVPAVIDAGYLKGDFHLHPEDYQDLLNHFMSRYYVSGYVSRETER